MLVASSTNTYQCNETKDYFVRNGRASGQNTALQSDDEVVLKWNTLQSKIMDRPTLVTLLKC